MADSIKDVFDSEIYDLKIDRGLYRRISQFERDFVNRDSDSIAFFGGNLIGVYPIRFKQDDRNRWFDDVMELDDFSAKEKLHSLPSINPSFNVQSDVFNMSCLWLVHVIYARGSGSSKDKEEAMLNVLLILHYRFLSSLIAHNFRYPADKSVALATYAELSKKFALKQHGSWFAYLKARCEDILSSRSIHRNTIEHFNDDDAITWMVGDVQDRLRKAFNKIREVFYRVRDQGGKVGFSSSTGMDIEGDVVVKDRFSRHGDYKRYLKEIIGDKRSFIKEPVLEVVGKAMHTMPEKRLLETLEFISDNYRAQGEVVIDELVDETLEHAFEVLQREGSRGVGNLTDLITRLRALYMASRSNDPSVMKMKDYAEKFVKKATGTKNNSVLASVRTGVLLYIVLRTFTKEHFS